jgi:hypothetical protein
LSTALQDRYVDCLTGSWLAERLAVDPLKIDAMRRAGELIGVRKPGSSDWLYPPWQFSEWRPRPAIPRIVAVARAAGIGESRLFEILTAPLGLRGTRRLADLLKEGRDDEVVQAVRLG